MKKRAGGSDMSRCLMCGSGMNTGRATVAEEFPFYARRDDVVLMRRFRRV